MVIGNPFSLPTGAPQGSVRTPFPGNIIPASLIDPVAYNLSQNNRIWALPTGPGAGFTGANNFSTSAVQPNDEDQVVMRMDRSIGANWKLFGTYALQTSLLVGSTLSTTVRISPLSAEMRKIGQRPL